MTFISIAQYRIDLDDVAGYAPKTVEGVHIIFIYRKSAEAYAELRFSSKEIADEVLECLDKIFKVISIQAMAAGFTPEDKYPTERKPS